ncbi:hypothetical protein AQUCO_29500001v1 [Aquilegia coerulea]|uniref:Uncharacterized protein n=1 Tax=Aquilegia coerulea TaxID=218851 RepID=A0A2G5C0I0_AQUCA|nr:hypothetical protein AQUCO_29500001v1 [Aquilegia coerulea]
MNGILVVDMAEELGFEGSDDFFSGIRVVYYMLLIVVCLLMKQTQYILYSGIYKRVELAVVGLHHPFIAGINYSRKNDKTLAY